MAKVSDNVFPRFLISEGGSTATPAAGRVTVYAKADGLLYQKDDAGIETLLAGASGAVATDAIWDAAGDLAVGSGANTAARLAIGATNGMALVRSAGAVAWALPSGYEYDYVANTGNTTISGTSEAAATALLTGNSVATYDGGDVFVEVMGPQVTCSAACTLWIYFDAGTTGIALSIDATTGNHPVYAKRRYAVAAGTHTISVRGSVPSSSATFYASATQLVWLRVTKA